MAHTHIYQHTPFAYIDSHCDYECMLGNNPAGRFLTLLTKKGKEDWQHFFDSPSLESGKTNREVLETQSGKINLEGERILLERIYAYPSRRDCLTAALRIVPTVYLGKSIMDEVITPESDRGLPLIKGTAATVAGQLWANRRDTIDGEQEKWMKSCYKYLNTQLIEKLEEKEKDANHCR